MWQIFVHKIFNKKSHTSCNFFTFRVNDDIQELYYYNSTLKAGVIGSLQNLEQLIIGYKVEFVDQRCQNTRYRPCFDSANQQMFVHL